MKINLELNNLPEAREEENGFENRPYFVDKKPDLTEIKEKAEEHGRENLVVIGNGGSVTSFRAYYKALKSSAEGEAYIVTSMDPDYLEELSQKLDPENTIVMPISKSGETVGVIEALLYFIDKSYPFFGVTSDKDSALKKIIEKNGEGFIEHKDVSGRYSGLTETGLVPAAFVGLDFEEIREGAEKVYNSFSKKPGNPAFKLASAMYEAEVNGYREVFTPFYSYKIFGYFPFLIQSMHETYCKDGKGQTFFGDMGPECQHHTIQRLFGGRKNLVTLLFKVEDHLKTFLNVDEEFKGIPVRGKPIQEFEDTGLDRSLEAELEGVKTVLKHEKMPFAEISVETVEPEVCGELLAFIQYFAYYSAKIRGLNPFNQPDVEKSKEIGFEKRFNGGR